MNLISDWLSTASIKYLTWPSPVFGQFQNGFNKVVIEPWVVKFWSEIILVISNQTRAVHLFNFEITRMILAQITFHSAQLPLLIPKTSSLILLTVFRLILIMLVWRIWYWIISNPIIYIFLYSHHLFAWYCTDKVRRNSVLVTHRS